MTQYAYGGDSFSLGDIGPQIAIAGTADTQLLKVNRDFSIAEVTFEATTVMADAGSHVIINLYRIRSTTKTKIYTYEFAADSVAYTPVTLAAVTAVATDSAVLAGDRFVGEIDNDTGAAITPGPWAIHIGAHPGADTATTEYTYT